MRLSQDPGPLPLKDSRMRAIAAPAPALAPHDSVAAASAPPIGAGSIVTLRLPNGRPLGSGAVVGTSGPRVFTVGRLQRPGDVASAFFADGVREVLLTPAGGYEVKAVILGTRFTSSGERLCELFVA